MLLRGESGRKRENIQKLKHRLQRKKKLSAGKTFDRASATNIRRLLNIGLGLKLYKNIIEPSLSDHQKVERKQIANGLRTNFRKEDTLRILFSDQKFFAIDGVFNSRNERVRVISRAAVDEKGDVMQKQKFSIEKVMVWLGAYTTGLIPLVILDEGTVDHSCYIKSALLVALKYGKEVLDDK